MEKWKIFISILVKYVECVKIINFLDIVNLWLLTIKKKYEYETWNSVYRASVSIKESDVSVLDNLGVFGQTASETRSLVLVVPRFSGVHGLGVTDPVRKVSRISGNDRPESVAGKLSQLLRRVRPD
jgi:hypothetical protein